jgi:hypothetical protein
MAKESTIEIRPYQPADRDRVLALAPRLTEWVASWRDPAAVLAAVQGWVKDSLDAIARPGHAVYVAAMGDGIAGFVTVTERTHFTGRPTRTSANSPCGRGWSGAGSPAS